MAVTPPAEAVPQRRRGPGPVIRYLWALVGVGAAFFLWLRLSPYLGEQVSFATFLFSTLAVAWYGGFGPAVVTTLGGFLSASYTFLPRRGSLAAVEPAEFAAVSLYLATGLGISLFGDAVRRSHRRAEEMATVADESLLSRDRELEQRRAAEERLREANDSLERRVLDRTRELERANASLAAGDERLSAVIGSTMDAILVFDEDLQLRIVNPAAERISGYRAEEILGKSVQKLVPARNQAQTAAYISEFAASGVRGRRIEDRGVLHGLRSDGTELPIEISISQTNVDGGRLFIAVVRDLSEQRRAEQELRRANAHLATALEAGEMGTWVYDLNTGKIDLDDVSLRLWGRTRAESAMADAETVFSIVHPEDRDFVRAQTGAALRTGHTLLMEYRVSLPTGGVRWHLSRARVVQEATGRTPQLVGVTIDITDRHVAEEARAQAQKLEALGTLVGGIAHDFNNVLMAIRGNAELALTQLDDGHPAIVCLAEITKAGSRARDIVKRILSFTRTGDPAFQVLSVTDALADAIQMLRSSLPAMVDLRFSPPVEDHHVRADPTQFQQVILNLGTNAAHAIGGHGRVVFSVDLDNLGPGRDPVLAGLPDGAYVLVTVSDDGCGIDEATMSRIFDPFFTTKGAGEGTGLGLSVVHGILKSHGGGIRVTSRPGEGSTFFVYLPVAHERPPSAAAAPAPAAQANGERVLFVDDESALVLLAIHALERIGYRVKGFELPELALRAFLTQPDEFDVVVTDLSMPHLDGFELARAILAERPAIPVVLMSGFVRPEEEEVARQIGIRKVLFKPDTVAELAHALSQILSGSADEPA